MGFERAADETAALLDRISLGGRDSEADSSPAARSASRLLTLLVPNSRTGMERESEDSLLFDDHATVHIPVRALIDDLAKEDSQRDFLLDPSYVGGATIEDVIYYQDVLLDMLFLVNRSLSEQLDVTRSVRHESMHDAYRESAVGAINTLSRNRLTAIEREIAKLGRLQSAIARTGSGLGSVIGRLRLSMQEIEEPFDLALQDLEQEADALEQDLERMLDLFVQLRTDGIPRSAAALRHTEPVGRIQRIDDASRFYTINLGRADNIRRGTRFMVKGERDGEQYAKAMIEVVDIMNENFSTCRLVQRFDDSEPIFAEDPIYNRFFHNGRFLRVALVGEFTPEVSPYTEERLIRFLEEIGCDVQEEADVNTDLVILSEQRDQLLAVFPEIQRYLELTELITLDEVLIGEVLPYFADR